MATNTIHTHADGGAYKLLLDGIRIKDDTTGEWVEGVAYLSAEDKLIRCTSAERWAQRFTGADYTGDDPAILALIHRANPVTDSGFNIIDVFETWGEREANLTAHVLDLAIAACIVKVQDEFHHEPVHEAELTITTQDLRQIVEGYQIERTPSASGWTIKLTKL